MSDKPILFSASMVRAILDGSKTQTRRALKPVKGLTLGNLQDEGERDSDVIRCARHQVREPIIKIGDRLWVREAWRTLHKFDGLKPSHLAPDISKITYDADPERRSPLWAFGKLRPSMFMPRFASRITLEVTGVKVERLQDCSNADAIAEGIEPYSGIDPECFGYLNYANNSEDGYWLPPVQSYRSLWNSINGPGAWEANPWVAAYSFTVIQKNIDQIAEAA